jgi:hypothetical protein
MEASIGGIKYNFAIPGTGIEIKLFEVSRYFSDYGNTNFNLSLLNLGNGYYLAACNSFRRYAEGALPRSLIADTLNNPNHPWLGGKGSTTWWKITAKGTDGSIIMVLDGNFRVLGIPVLISTVNDTRLFRNAAGEIIATTSAGVLRQQIGEDREKYGLPKDEARLKCGNVCGLINEYVIGSPVKVGREWEMTVQDRGPLCANLSVHGEKNWSLWSYNGRDFISYWLAPKHTVFIMEGNISRCAAKMEQEINIFQQVEQFYARKVIFSLSTPALPLGDGTMLAVGHLKIHLDGLRTDTPAHRFVTAVADLPHHPFEVIYLMYLYTFNPETFSLLQISNAFLPPAAKYALVFPEGLTHSDDGRFLISYGEGDVLMKIMAINLETVRSLLYSVENVNPADFNFYKL